MRVSCASSFYVILESLFIHNRMSERSVTVADIAACAKSGTIQSDRDGSDQRQSNIELLGGQFSAGGEFVRHRRLSGVSAAPLGRKAARDS